MKKFLIVLALVGTALIGAFASTNAGSQPKIDEASLMRENGMIGVIFGCHLYCHDQWGDVSQSAYNACMTGCTSWPWG